jgi:hypothetical protein
MRLFCPENVTRYQLLQVRNKIKRNPALIRGHEQVGYSCTFAVMTNAAVNVNAAPFAWGAPLVEEIRKRRFPYADIKRFSPDLPPIIMFSTPLARATFRPNQWDPEMQRRREIPGAGLECIAWHAVSRGHSQ